MAQARYTEASELTQVIKTELDGLASGSSALGNTQLSNNSSTTRNTLANFAVTLGTFQDARDTTLEVSLLIVPAGNGGTEYTDAIVSGVSTSYIARYADGTAVTWDLDAATTARDLTAAGVQIPNGEYKVGIYNNSGGQFAANGNIVYMSGTYSTTYA